MVSRKNHGLRVFCPRKVEHGAAETECKAIGLLTGESRVRSDGFGYPVIRVVDGGVEGKAVAGRRWDDIALCVNGKQTLARK